MSGNPLRLPQAPMILVCVLLQEGVSTKLLFALRSVSTIDHTIHAVSFLFSFKIQTVDFGGVEILLNSCFSFSIQYCALKKAISNMDFISNLSFCFVAGTVGEEFWKASGLILSFLSAKFGVTESKSHLYSFVFSMWDWDVEHILLSPQMSLWNAIMAQKYVFSEASWGIPVCICQNGFRRALTDIWVLMSSCC